MREQRIDEREAEREFARQEREAQEDERTKSMIFQLMMMSGPGANPVYALQENGSDDIAGMLMNWGAEEAFDMLFDLDPGAAYALTVMHDAFSGRGAYNRRTQEDHNCKAGGDQYDIPPAFSGQLPRGEFYRSNMVRARIVDNLGDKTFGMVDLNSKPFPLSISGEYGPVRGGIALAHEVGHIADQSLKLGLSHDKVHGLGLMYYMEGLPLLQAYEDFTASAK